MQKIVHHIEYGSLRSYARRSGFTAIITNEEGSCEQHVHVKYSMCSMKDQFSRKKGREMAEMATAKELHIKELPKFLQTLEGQCVLKDYDASDALVDTRYYKIALAFALDKE